MIVATGILTAIYFGCWPCSLFDTRLRFEEGKERFSRGEPVLGNQIRQTHHDEVNDDESISGMSNIKYSTGQGSSASQHGD